MDFVLPNTVVPEKTAIAIVCPSFGKRCGIARYSLYVLAALENSGYVVKQYATMRAAYDDMPKFNFARILVQHEYGLFDDLNPYLSAGETTSDIVVFKLLLSNNYPDTILYVIVHSYVTHELVHQVANKQLLKSGIVPFVLNATGAYVEAIDHLEHGVLGGVRESAGQNTELRPISRLKVGVFGFLKGNRGLDDLLDIVQASNAKLIAVLACNDADARRQFQEKLDRRHIVSDVSYDFLEEEDVLRYIEQADCFISLQSDIAHWGTTGSVRFLMQLGKPIFVYPHRQFYDMFDGVKFITKDSIVRELARIAEVPAYRSELASHVKTFVANNMIEDAYQRLFSPEDNESEIRRKRFMQALGEPSDVKLISIYVFAWLPEKALTSYLTRLGLGKFSKIFVGKEAPEERLRAIHEFLSVFDSRAQDGQNIYFTLSKNIAFNDIAGYDYIPIAMMNNGISFVRSIVSLLYNREVSESDLSLFCAFDTYEQKISLLELMDYSDLDREAVESVLLSKDEYGKAADRLEYSISEKLGSHLYFIKDNAPVFSGWELVGLTRAEFELKVKSLGLPGRLDFASLQANGGNIQSIIQQSAAAGWPVYWSDAVPRLVQYSRRHYWLSEFMYTSPEFFGLQVATCFFKRNPYMSEFEGAVAAAKKSIQDRVDFILDALNTANRFDDFTVYGLDQSIEFWKRHALLKGSFFAEEDHIDLETSNFLLVLRILSDRKIDRLR